MRKFLVLAAVAIFSSTASPAFAQEKAPTLEGAHQFIRQLVDKDAIAYVAGPYADLHGIVSGRTVSMRSFSVTSDACKTTFTDGEVWISVNWGGVAEVRGPATEGSSVTIAGGVAGGDEAYIGLSTIEIAYRFENVAKFLQQKCYPAADTGF